MTGGVRKRGEKWYYYFDASTVEGKRKKIERVGGNTKKEAQAALRKAIQDYERAGMHFDPTEMSVSDYMDHWFKNYVQMNCKLNSQICYDNIIRNHIKPQLGIYKVKALSPTVLQDFINDRYNQGFSKNHLINMHTVLKGSMKYAVFPCKFINENPMIYVRLPKYDHDREQMNHKIISKDEFEKILSRFPLGDSFYITLMIGYYTGCRLGEVMGLTWDDVDLDKGTVNVHRIAYRIKKETHIGSTKTPASNRTVLIGSTLIEALKKHRVQQMKYKIKYGEHYYLNYETEEIRGKDKVRTIISLPVSVDTNERKDLKQMNMICIRESGKMLAPSGMRYASKIINHELKIDFNFHSLRHTHATALIENGANIKEVQKRLGHDKIETTLNTYTHSTEKGAAKLIDIFEDAAKK